MNKPISGFLNKNKGFFISFIFIWFASFYNAQLDASFTSVPLSACPNQPFTLTLDNTTQGTGTLIYDWSIIGPGFSQSFSTSTVGVILSNPGLYSVTLTITDAANQTGTVTEVDYIEVYSEPIISYSLSATNGCEPLCVTFDGTNSTGGTGSGGITSITLTTDATSYFIDSITHCYTTPGVYSTSVIMQNAEGCVSSQNLSNITVDPVPVLTSPVTSPDICSGGTFTYTPTSSSAGVTFESTRITDPNINGGASSGLFNGTITELLTNSSSSPVTVIYQVTVQGVPPTLCDSIFNVSSIVNPTPVISVNDVTICDGNTANLTATVTGALGTGSFTWAPGGGSTQTISVSPAVTTVYTCDYTENGCPSNSAQGTVTVTPLPTVTVNDTTICAGDIATLIATPNALGGTYSWSPSGGSNDTATVNPSSTTTYTVSYILGCTGTGTGTVTVNPVPFNSISSTYNNSCYFPLNTTITSTGLNIDSISWSFPNGSLGGTPIPTPPTNGYIANAGSVDVQFPSEGAYDVTLTTWTALGCSTITTIPSAITVGDGNPPGSNILSINPDPAILCINDLFSVTYNHQTNGSNFINSTNGDKAEEVWWDWGDGSVMTLQSINPDPFAPPVATTHSYAVPGTYTITMVPWGMTGGNYTCSGDTLTFNVTVNGPAATLNVSHDCNSSLQAQLSPAYFGVGGTTTYAWDFGDGTTSNAAQPIDPISSITNAHTFPQYDTTYSISLTVSDFFTGCPDVTVSGSYIFYNNQPSFQAYNQSDTTQANGGFVKTDICLGETLWFYNETPGLAYVSPQNTNSLETRWDWDANGIVSFSASTAVRGQGRSRIFSASNGYSVGTWGIALRNEDPLGCRAKDTVIDYITIHGIENSFSIPNSICLSDPLNVDVSALDAPMSYIDSIFWDWGDGFTNTTYGSSINPPPAPSGHVYLNPGSYTITATVYDSVGCLDVLSNTINVNNPNASFNLDFNHICPGQGVNATDNSTGSGSINSWDWSAPNATPSTATGSTPPTFNFANQGSHPITLTITDGAGCVDDTTINVEVYDLTVSATASSMTLTCFNPPTPITFTNTSNVNGLPGFQYIDQTSAIWDFGNGQTSTMINGPAITYTAAGFYPVSLTLSSLSGCTSTFNLGSIQVDGPSGSINIVGGDTTICDGGSVDIQVTSADADIVTVFCGNGTTQSVTPNSTQTVTCIYSHVPAITTATCYIPQLFINDSGSACSGVVSSTDTVCVNPMPDISSISNLNLCSGDNSGNINFISSNVGTTFSWTNNNINIGLGANDTLVTNIPSFVATTPSSIVETSTIIVIPTLETNGVACDGSGELFFISVTPTPVIQNISDVTACNGDLTSGVTFNVNPVTAGCEWTNSNINIGLAAGPTTATGIGSFLATNNSSNTINGTITVTTQNGSCPGNTVTFDYIIDPTPDVNSTNDTTICSGNSTTQYDFTGSVTGTTYTWTALNTVNANAIGMVSTTGTNTISAFTTVNATSSPITVCIEIIPTGPATLNCPGIADTFCITVNPTPTVDPIVDQSDCAGANSVAVNFSGNNPLSTYDWTNDNTNIGLAASGTGDISSFVLTNSGFTTIVGNITVTPNLGGCTGASETFTITVIPIPDVFSVNDTSICAGDTTFPYAFSGNTAGSVYNWTASTPANAAAIGLASSNGVNNIPTFTTNNTTASPIVVDITISPFLLGCTGTSETFSFTINPTPIIDPIGDTVLCSGDTTLDYIFTGTAGTTYNWTNDNTNIGLAANGTGNILTFTTATPNNITETATITVTPEIGSCSGAPETFTITVNPTPIVIATPSTNQVLCEGDSSTAIIFSGLAGTSYQWDATPPINATNIGFPSVSGNGNIAAFLSLNGSLSSITTTIEITPSLGGCIGDSILIDFTVDPAAIVNTGNDTTICEGDILSLINASFGGSATSITWTTTGDGTFNNITTPNTSYTPGNNDLANGNVDLIITSNIPTGSCPADDDTINVTIDPMATVSAGNDTIICEGNSLQLQATLGGSATTILWTTNGTGTFAPNVNDPNAVYTPDANDIANGTVTLSITTNTPSVSCPAATDNLILVIEPAAIISAGNDTIICEGDILNLVNASFGGSATSITWTTTGDGTFNNITTPNTSYTPGNNDITNGSVSLVITSNTPTGSCPAVDDTINVTIDPMATVSVGNDTVICEGNSLQLQAVLGGSATTILWTTSGTGSFSSTTDPNAVYTPDANDIANGTVTLTITTNTPSLTCPAATDDLILTINPTPIIDPISNFTYCNGDNTTLINFTGTTGATFSWSNDNTNIGLGAFGTGDISSFVATNPGLTSIIGNLSVTPVLGICPGAPQTFTISVNPIPNVNTVLDTTLCAGDITNTYVFSGNISGTTYDWVASPSANANTIGLPATSGTNSIPPFTTLHDSSALSIPVNIQITPTINGCTGAPITYLITIDPPAIIDAGGGPTSTIGICTGGIVSLQAVPAGATSTTTWSTAGDGSFVDALNDTTDYTPGANDIANGFVLLTITTNSPTGLCSSSFDTVLVVISGATTVDAGLDQNWCDNTPIQLNGSFGGAASSITWSGGTGIYNPNTNDPLALYTPTAGELGNGFVTLTITTDDPIGPCVSETDDVTFTFVSGPTVDAGINDTICEGDNGSFIGSFGGSATSVTWSTSGDGTFTNPTNSTSDYTPGVNDISAGEATLYLTTDNPGAPCTAVLDSVKIIINLIPQVSAGLDTTICATGVVNLLGSFAGSASFITWSGGTGTFAPNANDPNAIYTPGAGDIANGNVTLTITTDDPVGPCPAVSDDILITINSSASIDAGVDTLICASDIMGLLGVITNTTASWSTSGDGTFDDPNIANANYTPGPGDIATGFVSLDLTSNAPSNSCLYTTDTMILSFNPAATVFAGLDTTICATGVVNLLGSFAGSASFITWSGGTGTFAPNANDPNAIYTPGAGDIANGNVTLTITTDDPVGPCPAVSDDILITINSSLLVNLGNDTSWCQGITDTLIANFNPTPSVGFTWETQGDGTFTTSSNDTTEYTPGAGDIIAGSIIITCSTNVATSSCLYTTDTIVITLLPGPTANAGVDVTICDSSIVNYSGAFGGTATSATWSTINGTGMFSPNNTSLIGTYTPTTADVNLGSVMIYLTTDLTAGACGQAVDSFLITFENSPIIDAGLDATICEGDNIILQGSCTIGATWTGGTNPFVPNNTNLNASYTPTAAEIIAGSIIFTLTSDNPGGACIAVNDVVVFTIEGTPQVTSSNILTMCSEDTVDLVLTSSIPSSFTWVATDNLSVIGESLTQQNLSYINDTLTNNSLFTQSVVYTITPTSLAASCIGPNQALIVNVNPKPTLNGMANDSICANGNSSLINWTSNIVGTTVLWENNIPAISNPNLTNGFGDISSFVALNNTGVILNSTVSAYPELNGCLGDTIYFDYVILPEIIANQTANQTICHDDTTTSIAFTGNSTSIVYEWINNNTSIGLAASGTGDISSFTVINNTGSNITATIAVIPSLNNCIGDTMFFTITAKPKPTLVAPANQTVCVGSPTNAIIFNPTPSISISSWTTSLQGIGFSSANGIGDIPSFVTSTVNPGNIDTAIISIVPDFNGCLGDTVSMYIAVIPTLQVNTINDITLCAEELFLGAVFTGNIPGIDFDWTNNNISIGLNGSGIGNIAPFTTTNTGTINQTGTITVTPTMTLPSFAICSGTSTSFTITVKPTPNVFGVPSQNICANDSIDTLIFNGNIPATVYEWTHNNVSIGLAGSGAGDTIPGFIGINTGLVSQTANLVVVPEYNGCYGDTLFLDLTVNPEPTVAPIPVTSYCDGETTISIIFDGNLGPASTYHWSCGNNTIGISPISGIDSIPSFTATNNTTNIESAVITIEPEYNGCLGDTVFATITVYPTPSVLITPASQVLCVNVSTAVVEFSGPVANSTYNWTSVNGSSIGMNPISGTNVSGVNAIPPFTTVNTSTGSITAQIFVTPEANGCSGPQDTAEITIIDPLPIVNPTVDASYCSGDIIPITAFTGNSPSNQYNWTTSNTSIGAGFSLTPSGTGDIPSFTAASTTAPQTSEFIVTPSIGSCNGIEDTFYITINPLPNVYNPGPQELCANDNTNSVNFFGDLAGTVFNWTNTNSSIGISGPGNGDILSFTALNTSNIAQIDNITVTPELNGCVGDDSTFTITVNPVSSVNLSNFEYCHDEITTAINFSGNNPASTFEWTNSNLTISNPPIITNGLNSVPSFTVSNTSLINQIATFEVIPMLQTNAMICPGDTGYFTITVKPIPTVIPPLNDTLCSGDIAGIYAWDGNMADSTSFSWSNNNTSIGLGASGVDTIFAFTATNIGQLVQTATITVTPELNGCYGNDTTLLITVNPVTIVNTANDTVCAGDYVDSISFSSPNIGTTYNWTAQNISIGIGANGVDTIPGFTAINTGTNVETCDIIVIPNLGTLQQCPGIPDTFQIVVKPMPIVNPTADQVLCANDTIAGIYFSGNIPGTLYSWVNDNTSIGLAGNGNDSIPEFPVVNTGTIDQTATIVVTPELNSCSGIADTFTFLVHPLPQVFAGNDTLLCFGQPYTPIASGATSYIWTPGNNGIPFFINDTTDFVVIGTDTNLCQNSDTVTVNYILDPPPVVDAGIDTAICDGLPYILLAAGNADLYVWEDLTPPSLGIMDGVQFYPDSTDIYVVIGYDASTGCYNSDSVEIIVHPYLQITANANDTMLCENDLLTLWGSGASGSAIYNWDNGVFDSITFIQPVGIETYTLIGLDGNNCSDTTDITITVNPNPVASFNSSMNLGGCIPFCPWFYDTSEPASDSVYWDFGNGTSSNSLDSVNACYDNYGTFDVTLTTYTIYGCSNTITIPDIVSVEPVVAAFTSDHNEQPISNPVFNLSNQSTNATQFEWTFGNGTQTSIIHPTVTYDSIGYYLITLTAWAQDGRDCADTATLLIKITDEIILYVPNTFTPDGDGLNDIFLPIVTAGVRDGTYIFKIFNRWGEEIFNTEDPEKGWDGTYLGEPVQDGTYIWSILFKDPLNNAKYPYQGHINLVR